MKKSTVASEAEICTKKTKKSKITPRQREASTSAESSEEEEEGPYKRDCRRKAKIEMKKGRHSEADEDEKKPKKTTKVEAHKDRNKITKRRKLEFATEESSGEEGMRRTMKHKVKTGNDSTSSASSIGESTDNETNKSRTDKNKHRDGKHFKKWLTLEKFDGTTPLSIFINQLDTCAKYNKWDLEDQASHLRVSLKGNAAYIIDDENLEGASCRRLIKRLKSRFGTKRQSSLYRSQLRTRRRGKKKTLQTLYHDINRMAGLAYPGKSSIHRKLASMMRSLTR